MKLKLGVLFLILFLSSCIPTPYSKTTKSTLIKSCNCTFTPVSIKHELPVGNTPWIRTITLPTSGKFVEESHYVSNADNLGKRQWPNTKTQGIYQHLKRSYDLYKKYDPKAKFEDLYLNSWQKEWTLEEGGHFGQGAVGNAQLTELTTEMEMWFITMMWTKGERPKRGTRFLLSANGKHVVVVAGFETGPSSQAYLGGVTREVHKWLSTNSESNITVSLLKDQSIQPGPVNCQQ